MGRGLTMKAQELRIGNWIKQPNGLNQIFQIDDVEDDYLINTFEESEIEPIPLTEEWMFRFGWHNAGYCDEGELWNNNDGFWLIKNTNEFSFFISEYSGMPPIKFVHQLQNVIFYMTGKEIE